MSEFSAPNALCRFICFRIPDIVKGLIKMRASQIEAFLQTELSQGWNTISLTLVLRVCQAYLEVKIWLGDGGRLSEYYRIACAKVSTQIFRRTSFRWLSNGSP